MTDNYLLNAALAYAARGWSIFPCRDGLKVPYTTHGVKDATRNVDTIIAWWSRWPRANIALACGPESGVYVVDIDVDEEKGINGWESLKEFQPLPDTIKQNSPRGGAHFLFKTDTPPRNKNSFRTGIDIRSTGYYIMLSPSIHPNGKPYQWDVAPDEIDIAEFPESMRPADAPKPERPWLKTSVNAPRSTTTSEILERARLYLAECEPATQGQAGHDKLLWAASAMVNGFELSNNDALSLLWSDFNPRCNPPWDRSNGSDVKDFERKVTEASKSCSKPRGWLLKEQNEFNEACLLAAKQSAEALIAGTKKKPDPEICLPSILIPKNNVGKVSDITYPPGLVGNIAKWITDSAGCPQPLLSIGVSLTACGALFGRKVKDNSNGRTNIYMMGVAPSSSGKDHPGDCIDQLLTAAGASNIMGGSRVTSDTAIELALMANPVQFFKWDEVGHMFASIKDAGNSGSQHLRTIVPALMELYSSSHKMFIGKQKAEGELRKIDQPHVCIWGLTSPDVLFSGISTSELRDGWLGRVITLISKDRPKYQIKDFTPPPSNLVEIVKGWVVMQVPSDTNTGDILSSITCNQILVPTHHGAMKVYEKFRDECYKRMLHEADLSEDTQYLWGKALQNARRVGLCIACGDRFTGAEILEQHAKWSCEFIRSNIEMFSISIAENMSNSSFEKEKQSLLKIISACGPAGISKSSLTRKSQSIKDGKTRNSFLDDMREAGLIVVGPNTESMNQTWIWKT